MKRHRRLRKLTPDPDLFRRRAAGATFRELAPDYGVSHTALSRYFARPEARKQLKQAGQLLRAEQRAAEARWQAGQRAERETGRLAKRQVAAERTAPGRAHPDDAPQLEPALSRRPDRSSAQAADSTEPRDSHQQPGRRDSRQPPRFATAEERFDYYWSLRLRSENDWLNFNDVAAGRLTPAERRLPKDR